MTRLPKHIANVRLLIDADAERHPLSGEHVEIVWPRVPRA